MKWKKLGKIFDPRDFKLANNCQEFAQSPQTLVFDDFIRIYFSTREKETSGKYLSHISFVDFDIHIKKVLKISEKMVIELGKLGAFDEHGIFPLNIFKDNNDIYGYIGGWSRKESVSVETSIGLSKSLDNGMTFKRLGDGPILSSSLKEPFLVGDPFVSKFKDTYYMWYIYGTSWINNPENDVAERIYKIGYATSSDAINWEKQNSKLVDDKVGTHECQALPTVIHFNDAYHMVFCYRHAIGFRTDKVKAYKLGYAWSTDLKNWTRDDDRLGMEFPENEWDSDMQCYPHIFKCNNKIYLLYNGNEFGRFGFGLAELER